MLSPPAGCLQAPPPSHWSVVILVTFFGSTVYIALHCVAGFEEGTASYTKHQCCFVVKMMAKRGRLDYEDYERHISGKALNLARKSTCLAFNFSHLTNYIKQTNKKMRKKNKQTSKQTNNKTTHLPTLSNRNQLLEGTTSHSLAAHFSCDVDIS